MSRTTNTDIPLAEEPERDYGRKPYYTGPGIDELPFKQALKSGSPDGGAYGAMMSRTNYKYSKQEHLQHSQFKKPYMPEEFLEMEGFNDYLELLQFDDWDITWELEVPPGGTGGTTEGLGSCFVVCQIKRMRYEWSDDCSTLTAFFFGEYTGDALEDPLRRGRRTGPSSDNVYIESTSHQVARSGPMWLGPFLYPQTFTFVVGSGEDVSAIFMQDTQAQCPDLNYGSCKKKLVAENDCSACVPGMYWDWENSAMQGSEGDEIDVFVVGGDGNNYEWSIDQTDGCGFSLGSTTTTVPENTILLSAVQCEGTAEITVTSCGGVESATGSVRSVSGGSWSTVSQNHFTGSITIPSSSGQLGANLDGDGYFVCTDSISVSFVNGVLTGSSPSNVNTSDFMDATHLVPDGGFPIIEQRGGFLYHHRGQFDDDFPYEFENIYGSCGPACGGSCYWGMYTQEAIDAINRTIEPFKLQGHTFEWSLFLPNRTACCYDGDNGCDPGDTYYCKEVTQNYSWHTYLGTWVITQKWKSSCV
ncbi:MAG: hypothetical protein KAV87_28150 [Desulfobacteraceae bacterium]|nr:hypothetical protein [Desulfobacteraceae bacterium]